MCPAVLSALLLSRFCIFEGDTVDSIWTCYVWLIKTIIHHFTPAVECDLTGKFHPCIEQGSIVTVLYYICTLEMPYHVLVIIPAVITGSSLFPSISS